MDLLTFNNFKMKLSGKCFLTIHRNTFFFKLPADALATVHTVSLYHTFILVSTLLVTPATAPTGVA